MNAKVEQASPGDAVEDVRWRRAKERAIEGRISAFARRNGALPLPGTIIAIRGLVTAVMPHAKQSFDEDIECAGIACTCREEIILICAAMKIVELAGGDEDTEVKLWKEDFQKYLRGLS